MANIAVSAVFPSAKFIQTDSKGDLQEVVGSDATSSSATYQGISIESVDTGTSANGITFRITESTGSPDAISESSNVVSLDLENLASLYYLDQANPAVKASGSGLDLSVEAITAGEAGNNISVEINDQQSSDGISVSGNVVEITLTGYSYNRTLNDISTIISGAGASVTALVSLSVTGSLSDPASSGVINLSGGRDEIQSISDIISGAGTDVTDLVTITITGSASDPLTGAGARTLSGATDATAGELASNKSYLIISTDDIYDYDGVAEEADGRKTFFGLLETATQNITALADKPENLLVNRGSLILLSDTKMRRSYSITATLDIIDTDLSAES